MSKLLERIALHDAHHALIHRDEIVTYRDLHAEVQRKMEFVRNQGIPDSPSVIAVVGEYSLHTCSLLLALLELGHILVPMTGQTFKTSGPEFMRIAEVEYIFTMDGQIEVCLKKSDEFAEHALLQKLKQSRSPGLILFSSGTTGKSKASLLDLGKIVDQLDQLPSKPLRTLIFLLIDHIGGINSLLRTLYSGGTLITPRDMSVNLVCQEIEKHRVELLPTSPSFLNMLVLSDAHKRYDLSSLRLITYGTEPMPPSLLSQLNQIFPHVRFKQTYGLTELGILSTQSKASDSLLMKVGGQGFNVKIVNNVLWIKSDTAMLGYLNADQPFDAEGWFNTQDEVEEVGDYIRIKGRISDIINVGGQKVYPAEVESVLREISWIEDVLVHKKKSPVLGEVVSAKVVTDADMSVPEMLKEIRAFCKNRLDDYKLPMFLTKDQQGLVGDRFKKMRAHS